MSVPGKPRAPHCSIWQGGDVPLSSGVSLAERHVGNEALGQGGGQVSVLPAGPEGQPTPHLPRNPTAPTGRMLVGLPVLQGSSLSPSLTRTPDFRAHSSFWLHTLTLRELRFQLCLERKAREACVSGRAFVFRSMRCHSAVQGVLALPSGPCSAGSQHRYGEV